MCEQCDFKRKVILFCEELNKLQRKYDVHIYNVEKGMNMLVLDGLEWEAKRDIEDTLEAIVNLANKK